MSFSSDNHRGFASGLTRAGDRLGLYFPTIANEVKYHTATNVAVSQAEPAAFAPALNLSEMTPGVCNLALIVRDVPGTRPTDEEWILRLHAAVEG